MLPSENMANRSIVLYVVPLVLTSGVPSHEPE